MRECWRGRDYRSNGELYCVHFNSLCAPGIRVQRKMQSHLVRFAWYRSAYTTQDSRQVHAKERFDTHFCAYYIIPAHRSLITRIEFASFFFTLSSSLVARHSSEFSAIIGLHAYTKPVRCTQKVALADNVGCSNFQQTTEKNKHAVCYTYAEKILLKIIMPSRWHENASGNWHSGLIQLVQHLVCSRRRILHFFCI